MSLSGGSGCSSCKARWKKRDGASSRCKTCTHEGIECARYPIALLGNLSYVTPDLRQNPSQNFHVALAPAPYSHGVDGLAPLTINASGLAPVSHTATTNPSAPMDIIDHPPHAVQGASGSTDTTAAPNFASQTSFSETCTVTGTCHMRIKGLLETNTVDASPNASCLQPTCAGTLAPTYEAYDSPNTDLTLKYPPAPSHNSSLEPLTPGRASLLNALFSLALPGDEPFDPSAITTQQLGPSNEVWCSTDSENGGTTHELIVDGANDLDDTEGSSDIIAKGLTLDRNVKSNSLPFILECYALWMSRMLFQPLRVAAAGRERVLQRYGHSDAARWRLMLIANFSRVIAWNTTYDISQLLALTTFQDHMSRGYMLVKPPTGNHWHSPSSINTFSIMDAFDHTHELICVSLKVLPLSTILLIMQNAAPIFRYTCPDPPQGIVHLPSLLLNTDVNLRSYATTDVLLSILTDRPMFFRYNVDFTTEITESMLYVENHLGLQWQTGVPDRLIVTLARVNAIREDFGICVDSNIIKGLEMEIGSFTPVVGVSTSSDPILSVARLVVQECWRQAAYIYLYMGLCGADAQDTRVVTIHNRFMKLLKGTKPARHPDVFLALPMVILSRRFSRLMK